MENLKTALYNLHQKHGAKFVPFAGYQMPIQYSKGIIEEHKSTRENAGIFDVSHMGQLFIKGDDTLAKDLERIFPAELSKANLNRTEKLLTETLGALGTAEVVPILLSISKDPEINVGIRNRAIEILGKKEPMEVATAFAELLGDPKTNMEVRDFAFNTLGGVKEENLILALLQTYNTGKKQYFSMLNTVLDALGEFNDAEVRLAVTEIALNEDYSPALRMKAIQKLGEFGDKNVIPKLLNVLETSDNYIYRNAIIRSLDAMGELESHEQTLRRLAFEAHLGKTQ